jgi:hypothetical protein
MAGTVNMAEAARMLRAVVGAAERPRTTDEDSR